jgi:hypothetical protein
MAWHSVQTCMRCRAYPSRARELNSASGFSLRVEQMRFANSVLLMTATNATRDRVSGKARLTDLVLRCRPLISDAGSDAMAKAPVVNSCTYRCTEFFLLRFHSQHSVAKKAGRKEPRSSCVGNFCTRAGDGVARDEPLEKIQFTQWPGKVSLFTHDNGEKHPSMTWLLRVEL